ncbi:MAG: MotA/TolQ/ExbB proton channel family protein [Elusimicrobia bacterium]|nr:MotA/TolQ/ExbB proton channel family protein [Elusimicrobiota bacterium]
MITLFKGMALTGGEWVIYLLGICSILAVAVMVERTILFSKEKKEFKKVEEEFLKVLQSLNFNQISQTFQNFTGLSGTILRTGLLQSQRGAQAVEEEILSVTSKEKQRLEKRMIILGTLGNNAIYIGLFGTVLGVIKAFHDLSENGNSGPEVVMQGLSEALIATAVGLLVALPCVVAYNILQKQIKDLLLDTESLARLLLAKLKS